MGGQIEFKIQKGKKFYLFVQEVDSAARGLRLSEDLRSLADVISVCFISDVVFKEVNE